MGQIWTQYEKMPHQVTEVNFFANGQLILICPGLPGPNLLISKNLRMVTPASKQAMWPEPHDFIHLDFSNYNQQTPEVIKFYENGLSLRDIEARLGISKTRVRRLLLGAGVVLRDSTRERQRATQGSTSKKAVKPPYGFCFDEGRVVRHPKEYPHLLSIIQRWKLGQPLNSIATWLNGKKVHSPMGRQWSWNSIANIIQRIKSGQLIEKGDYYELR